MKLWGGRFTKETDQLVQNFNESLSFDQKFYRQDIRGSIAHVKMLAKQGILTEADRDAIVAGLEGIREDLDSGRLVIPSDSEYEDIHSFVEVNSQSTLIRNASATDNLRWQRCRKRRVSIRFWTAKNNTAKPTPRKNLGDRSILLKASTSNSRIIIPAMTTSPMEAATHKCHFFILLSKNYYTFYI